jgi:hypothetical protein
MFHLHDKTRRKLAIAGFILLCLLPTCAIAGWCFWRNMPWETQIAAEQLQQQLGWKVKLDHIKHPRPGVEIYENLELSDPETGRFIFSCRSVEISRRMIADPQGQEKPTLIFAFQESEIGVATLTQMGQFIERVLQDQAMTGMDCRLSTSELKMRRGKTVQKLSNVEAGVDHSASCVQAAMQFHLPQAKTAAPVVIRLYRDRTITPPQNRFELQTAENEVPCDLLALGIPEFAKYDSQTCFQGNLEFNYFQQIRPDKDWSETMTGRLSNIKDNPQTN